MACRLAMLGAVQLAALVVALPGAAAPTHFPDPDRVHVPLTRLTALAGHRDQGCHIGFAWILYRGDGAQDVEYVREELVPLIDPKLPKPRRVLPEKA